MKKQTIILFIGSALFLGALLLLAAFAGIGESLMEQVQSWQKLFHDTLQSHIASIKSTPGWLSYGGLCLLGFLYGVFHAVGPGHGKVIVASYMLATPNSLRQGLWISFLSAMLQSAVAVLLVLITFAVLGLARTKTETAANLLEAVGFSLIAFVGILLFTRGAGEAYRLWQKPVVTGEAEDGNGAGGCSHDHHDHQHAQSTASAEIGPWRTRAFMIFSIGIRPCSGAVLLMLFAAMAGLYSAGILATFTMGIGTAAATAFLAFLTVRAKNLALRWVAGSAGAMNIAHAALSLVGGGLITLFGLLFAVAHFAHL